MFNGMMDPEMIRLAQEQMSKMSPSDLAKIQQQMMSNPELIKLATESMKNMRPEEMRNAAEQLKHVRPEDMAEIGEKMAKATPEELAAMRAHADAQAMYELNAALILKKQGNDLHGQGKFREAALKYLHAKNNLKNIPLTKGRALKLACSLNLMSCYLKTKQFEDCIDEGSEVLAYDVENAKALYRRGQAYKELGNLEAAISDLTKAHSVSPDDETIADVLRDVKEKLTNGGTRRISQGVIIEEITEEEFQPTQFECNSGSQRQYSTTQQREGGEWSQSQVASSSRGPADADADGLKNQRDNQEAAGSFRDFVANADPDALAALSFGEVSPDMVKAASDMMQKMTPEEVQKMLEMATSFNQNSRPNGEGLVNGFRPPEVSPSMVKAASDLISKMSPEELQKMLQTAASLKEKDLYSSASMPSGVNNQRPKKSEGECSQGEDRSNLSGLCTDSEGLQNVKDNPEALRSFHEFVSNADPDTLASLGPGGLSPDMVKTASDMISKMSPEELKKMLELASSFDGKLPPFPNATAGNSSEVSREGSYSPNENSNVGGNSLDRLKNLRASPSSSTVGMQEQMMNQMNDPAVRQMFTSMIKNMSPDMMANMSEKFGVKLSREEAAKAQQVMSSLSLEDLDRVMRWVDRANKAVHGVKKTKNWLLGRPGMILATAMLFLAVILHCLGFIGG